jgi:hypothetical protein
MAGGGGSGFFWNVFFIEVGGLGGAFDKALAAEAGAFMSALAAEAGAFVSAGAFAGFHWNFDPDDLFWLFMF